MAAGVYGKSYQTSIQKEPLTPDMKGTPFAYLEWGLSLALKHWMELNPQVKYITYKDGRYGGRNDIRYLKDLPSFLYKGMACAWWNSNTLYSNDSWKKGIYAPSR